MERRRLLTVGVVACAIVAGAAGGDSARGDHASRPAHRSRVLAALDRRVGAGRVFPVRQPDVERNRVPARRVRTRGAHEAGAGVSRRRARAELHLHRGDQAGDRDHLRHPPRQLAAPVDVQGDLRADQGSRRLRLDAVLEAASRTSVSRFARRRPVRRVRFDRRATRRSTSATSRPSTTGCVKFHGLPLSPRELDGLRRIYRVFFDRGAAIRFSPTYADLMTATDEAGVFRSYLASESPASRSFAISKPATSSSPSSATSAGRRRFVRSGRI